MTIINLKLLSLNRIEVKNVGFLESVLIIFELILALKRLCYSSPQLYCFHAFTFLMCPSATTITTVISILIISSKPAQSRKIVIQCLFFSLAGFFKTMWWTVIVAAFLLLIMVIIVVCLVIKRPKPSSR